MPVSADKIMTSFDATELMNCLGKDKIPFFFLIDFEMKAVRIFHEFNSPDNSIMFDFQETPYKKSKLRKEMQFKFKKNPVSFNSYYSSFLKVQKNILSGNTFLLNLTFPTRIETSLSLKNIYLNSAAKYKVLIDNEFVCFSPETFIKIKDGIISTYPMKGTIKVTTENPVNKLLNDIKETAEHNTVVDLLRNDLSMVSSDVRVERFRYIDKINTHEGQLLQVSSEIKGVLPLNYTSRLGEIIFKLLPAGSVTGAPKEMTVKIIKEVEKHERGYYTGICGYFNGKDLDSAVMIRFIENRHGKLYFRSGGGITFMSEAINEYNELIEKVYVPIV